MTTWSATGQLESVSPSTEIISTRSESSAPPMSISRLRVVSNETDIAEKSASVGGGASVSAHALYPHLFDSDTGDGQAIALLNQAAEDAVRALESHDQADLVDIQTRFTQIAAAAARAHALTVFNENFGSVVSFIRRATLMTPAADISRSALNQLIVALKRLLHEPMIDLDDATDIIDDLMADGWEGAYRAADDLLAALIAEQNEQDEPVAVRET
ncbi:MAG: hypothetical protein JWN23_2245 [Rhodocyclales bacterium]|nr:hypothetical protein [Rhodocyclales bacterium]